ncbi:MAG TPA: GNAT family N-acetyltransferase [Thermoanaerobaculia bacterium]|nr:GNAT family N-acetyltransferase [Thermoanaerobaculia bacterium]
MSFLSPFSVEGAEAWWRRTFSEARRAAVFLVARDGGDIVGTVQLHPAWAPNQPHRADVAKLLVDPKARGGGLGARLMERIEEEARREGFTLLTLDAKGGTAAERLYRRSGWKAVGAIPGFAFDPDGKTPHDAVIFYKALATGKKRSDGMRKKTRAKKSKKPKTIDQYLADVPPEKRKALQKLRATIHAGFPRAEETISYGVPAFRLDGSVIAWFAAAANHCSFFPGGVLEPFAKELAGYETSKGTIRFQPEKPLPAALVRKLVKARIARAASKKSRK